MKGEKMMYPKKAIDFLKIERECVSRDCNRNCGACDLAQDRQELLSAYDCAIQYMQDRVKSYLPKLEWHRNQRKWLYYCGNCGHGIHRVAGADGIMNAGDYCPCCGRHVDWRVWMNEKEYFQEQTKKERTENECHADC